MTACENNRAGKRGERGLMSSKINKRFWDLRYSSRCHSSVLLTVVLLCVCVSVFLGIIFRTKYFEATENRWFSCHKQMNVQKIPNTFSSWRLLNDDGSIAFYESRVRFLIRFFVRVRPYTAQLELSAFCNREFFFTKTLFASPSLNTNIWDAAGFLCYVDNFGQLI